MKSTFHPENQSANSQNSHRSMLLQYVTDAVITTDMDLIITDWNPAAEAVYGWTMDQAVGVHLNERIYIQYPEISTEALLEVVLETGSWQGELIQIKQDGTTINISSSISLLKDETNKPIGTILINRDVTARKEVEQALEHYAVELELAKEQAEIANQIKSEFLANMSHEMRTPLNGILGMTQLTLDTELTAIQREYLHMVNDSASTLLAAINEILDFSKLEAGKLDFDNIEFSLQRRLDQMLNLLAMRAMDKELELSHYISPDVPHNLIGDPGRLCQILTNLVENAIKFTHEGEIVVRVNVASRTKQSVRLQFSISDTGIGIPEDIRPYIFNAFTQADGSTTRRFGGTGLGLTLSAKLTKLMGGEIWVDSKVNEGSTFHFTAQFDLTECLSVPASVNVTDLAELPVLIVDDNETARQILSEMVRNWSLDPTAVPSVDTAFKAINEAITQGNPFSVIILDAEMGDEDGFSLVRQLKASSMLSQAIVMLISPTDQANGVEQCHKLALPYITKPVSQSDLLDTILQALVPVTAPAISASIHFQRSDDYSQGLHILVGEDSPVNQKFVAAMLKKQGHTFLIGNNGHEVLTAFQQERFDLVLLDIQMPEMNGFETTTAIRKLEEAANTHTPIIALIAHAMKGDQEHCLDMGMDAYITKPLQGQVLASVIDELMIMHNKKQQRQPTSSTQSESPISWQAALDLLEGDVELLEEIVALFIDTLPDHMHTIQTAIEDEDGNTLRAITHKLSGSVGNLAIDRLFNISKTLESCAAKDDFSGAAVALKSLEREAKRIEQAANTIGRGTN